MTPEQTWSLPLYLQTLFKFTTMPKSFFQVQPTVYCQQPFSLNVLFGLLNNITRTSRQQNSPGITGFNYIYQILPLYLIVIAAIIIIEYMVKCLF